LFAGQRSDEIARLPERPSRTSIIGGRRQSLPGS
jgi:hypothetical protein